MASPIIPKKGPRVPLPSRSEQSREAATPLLPEAPAPAAPPAAPVRSQVSSAAVTASSVASMAPSMPVPARANLSPALTPVPAYTYRPTGPTTGPTTYITAPPVTVPKPPVTVAAPIVTTSAAPVASQPMASAQALFDVLDANGDGVLDANEFAQLRTLDGRRAQPPMEPVTVPIPESQRHVVRCWQLLDSSSELPTIPVHQKRWSSDISFRSIDTLIPLDF